MPNELARLALLSIVSPHTRRAYGAAIAKFLTSGHQISRTGILAWIDDLSSAGTGTVALNIHLAAVRKLVYEAYTRNLITDQDMNAIDRIKSRKVVGVRLGNWTDLDGIRALLRNEPLARNRAILACMIGCGLRRSEISSLDWSQWQQRDARWLWIDIKGKGGRVRTVPAPNWVADYVNQWQGEEHT